MHIDDLNLCRNQLMSFYRYLDLRDYDSLTELLSESVRWERQGKLLSGKSAVRHALDQRSATMRIHHLLTNVAALDIADTYCTLSAYMLVVRHDDGRVSSQAAPLTGIESIRMTYADLVLHDKTWLIERLHSDEITFLAPGR